MRMVAGTAGPRGVDAIRGRLVSSTFEVMGGLRRTGGGARWNPSRFGVCHTYFGQ